MICQNGSNAKLAFDEGRFGRETQFEIASLLLKAALTCWQLGQG